MPVRLRRIGIALGAVLLVLLMGVMGQPLTGLLGDAAVKAQPAVVLRRVDPVAIASQVYQQYPDLPPENQYHQAGSGEIALTDTLVSRFIRYHLYTKDRPANFRLDWKLSVADYLGAFESIVPDAYPSADILTENPARGDQAAIQSLSRTQRNHLVQSLFEIFTGYRAGTGADIDGHGSVELLSPIPAPTPPSAADLLL